MVRIRLALVPFVLLLVLVIGPPALAQMQPRTCSTIGQNLFVRDVVQDLYFWYQYAPDPDPVKFRSPYDYLEAVRYRPLDQTFSYITTKASNEAFFSESQFIGFGLSTQSQTDGATVTMRVSEVYPDSPASTAGLSRGDFILSVGGRTVTDWWRAGQLGAAFGPSEVGYQATVVYQRPSAQPVQVTMTKRLVTIPTVSLTRVYERDGRRIGYLFFRNFVTPSTAALNDAFAQLKQAGVNDLVLDLRYNGGGLVSVSQHLASLIGGTRTSGQVFAQFLFNDRYAPWNQLLRFEPTPAQALSLDRVIVIATPSSASASELVINSLRPFIPVIVIGDRTFGKPVGQEQLEFCDKVLALVAFTLRNANGQGDYFGGIPADCPAPDDLNHQLGDPGEASLGEALFYAQFGTCAEVHGLSSRAKAGNVTESPSPMAVPIPLSGFQQLVGAW